MECPVGCGKVIVQDEVGAFVWSTFKTNLIILVLALSSHLFLSSCILRAIDSYTVTSGRQI